MKLVRAKEGYRKVGDKYLLAKKCTKCGRWLVANTDNFHKDKGGKYGLYCQCKECVNNKNNPVNTDPNITKVCTECGREFPATLEYFHKKKCGKYGLREICKFCIAEKNFESDGNPVNTDPNITKVCTECGKEFPATKEYFYKSKNGKYGLLNECKECTSKKNRTRNNPVNTDPSILQRCTKCGKRLPATTEYFYKSKTGKYGVMKICKECNNRRTWEWQHREELAQRQALLEAHRKKMDEEKARKIEARKPLVAEKTCSKCGKTKPASEFHANVRSKDHLASQCKECANAKAREIYYHKLETMSFGE